MPQFGQPQKLLGKPPQDRQQLGVLADERDQTAEEDIGGDGEVFHRDPFYQFPFRLGVG